MPTSRPAPTPATAVADHPVATSRVTAHGAHPTSGSDHMIGNARLDAAWLWQWPEAFQAAKATFRSALDRMREYPEFVFTSSSAAYHEWIERGDPAMFAEIRERVREGRWQIVGGWWVEADCNVPSGESLVRQGRVGQRWFATHLGRPATVGFNPDAFGHAASLPATLRGQGMDAYLFLRPQPHERDLPGGPFRWQSADGSEVIALRIPFEYCAPRAALDRQLEQVLERLGDGWREHVMFARQVEALVAPGDVVVAITTSGRSGKRAARPRRGPRPRSDDGGAEWQRRRQGRAHRRPCARRPVRLDRARPGDARAADPSRVRAPRRGTAGAGIAVSVAAAGFARRVVPSDEESLLVLRNTRDSPRAGLEGVAPA